MATPQKKNSGSSRSSFHASFRQAGPYLTLGLELGFTMIIWMVIGYLLDLWLDTLPWLTLAGVFVGMVSLFIQLVRAAGKANKGTQAKDRSRPKDGE